MQLLEPSEPQPVRHSSGELLLKIIAALFVLAVLAVSTAVAQDQIDPVAAEGLVPAEDADSLRAIVAPDQ